ncbi:tetratricopeptide repeat protein [Candidatus Similichlamydia epinepheli]|uniref:tetratricopeptide repeat protein n=1 Tax=Candidatus Similichlamydia epinepheli TaxID=1903953 RepID=UPI001300751F|nr:HrpB1 family type III secretion system apparatus protein [Candidatus Similichlamydia epinepheli]
MKEILSLCREDLHLFLEAGVTLTTWRNDKGALKLITAAKILAPDSLVPDLCLSHLSMQRMNFTAAIRALERVLHNDPEHPLAMAMMGVCLAFSPKTQKIGVELIQVAKQKTGDSEVLRMCEIASSWIETDRRFKEEESLLIPKTEK